MDVDAARGSRCNGGLRRGLASQGFRGGVLADQEFRLAFYHYMIDRYMAGERPGTN